jgi:putative peptidoglycan lipid II flippase
MSQAAGEPLPLHPDASSGRPSGSVSTDIQVATTSEPAGSASLVQKLRDALSHGTLLRAMVQGFMTVAALTLLAKAVSFFKDAAVAGRFGVSDSLDAFALAFGIHTFASSLLGGGLPAAFLPAYAKLKHRRGSLRAERLGVQTAMMHLGTLSCAVLVFWVGGPWIIQFLGHGFPAEKQALALDLLRSLTPFLICFGMTTHLGSWLQGNKLFAVAAATPILTPAAILLAIILTPHDAPVQVLVWGTNAGALLHFLVLCIVISRRCPLTWQWLGRCARLPEPANRTVLASALPFLLASLVLGSAPIVDQAMAAQLASGSVTVLSYSEKICGIILALTASAAAEAMFPFFADAVARRDWTGLKQQLRNTIGSILAVAVPLVAILCWQAPLIVKILFERGEFAPEHTARVAEVLRCASLQIPFYITSMLMSKVVVSLQANWFTLVTALTCLASNIIFNAILMRHLGVAGIALSTAIVYVISCALLVTYLLKTIRQLSLEDETARRLPA